MFHIRPQDSHAMLLSLPRDLRRLTQAQSSTNICSFCFEDAETVFTIRHVVEPYSLEAYRGRVIDCFHS